MWPDSIPATRGGPERGIYARIEERGHELAHIELFRSWMEDRGLAASTMDRRLSTVCGFYRFAPIDGRIRSNPARYVRRPQVHPSDARALDRSELGVFLFTRGAVRPRSRRACRAGGVERARGPDPAAP